MNYKIIFITGFVLAACLPKAKPESFATDLYYYLKDNSPAEKIAIQPTFEKKLQIILNTLEYTHNLITQKPNTLRSMVGNYSLSEELFNPLLQQISSLKYEYEQTNFDALKVCIKNLKESFAQFARKQDLNDCLKFEKEIENILEQKVEVKYIYLEPTRNAEPTPNIIVNLDELNLDPELKMLIEKICSLKATLNQLNQKEKLEFIRRQKIAEQLLEQLILREEKFRKNLQNFFSIHKSQVEEIVANRKTIKAAVFR
jgi:hypothetical protein